MFYINIIILILFVILSVAFLTLLERKVLGYIQNRKGPNKLGLIGIFQPFGDAIRLFTKEQIIPSTSNFLIYFFSPLFILFLSLILWLVFPFAVNCINFNYGILFFFCCTGLSVYRIIICGWSSCTIYSLLGGLRGIAQTISYEVSLVIIFFSFIFLIDRYSFLDFYYYQNDTWFLFLSIPLSIIWMSSSLAETNRSPFDFAEGESELVSGFNIEYRGLGFSFIFLSEYSSIIFIRIMYSILFLGCNLNSYIFFIKVTLICFLFIWVRGTLPRFRYDRLIYIAWKSYLPISLNYFFFFLGFKSLLI